MTRKIVVQGTLGHYQCNYYLDKLFGEGGTHNKELVIDLLNWWDRIRVIYTYYHATERIARRTYTDMLNTVDEYKAKIKPGEHEDNALYIVGLVREWLRLELSNRVPLPSNGRCRVY